MNEPYFHRLDESSCPLLACGRMKAIWCSKVQRASGGQEAVQYAAPRAAAGGRQLFHCGRGAPRRSGGHQLGPHAILIILPCFHVYSVHRFDGERALLRHLRAPGHGAPRIGLHGGRELVVVSAVHIVVLFTWGGAQVQGCKLPQQAPHPSALNNFGENARWTPQLSGGGATREKAESRSGRCSAMGARRQLVTFFTAAAARACKAAFFALQALSAAALEAAAVEDEPKDANQDGSPNDGDGGDLPGVPILGPKLLGPKLEVLHASRGDTRYCQAEEMPAPAV